MSANYFNPLNTGLSVLSNWGFVYDYNDSEMGGYVNGEFLLRSDGKLFRRSGGSSTSFEKGKPITVWKFNTWEQEHRWTGGPNSQDCLKWLQNQGYDLHEPSLCPIDKPCSEPSPGIPPLAKFISEIE